jgi:hypothetical protein
VTACRFPLWLERDAVVGDFSPAHRLLQERKARRLAWLRVTPLEEESFVAESCVAEYHAELAAEPFRLRLEPRLG